MGDLRQAYLGATAAKVLTIVNPVVRAETPSILSFPQLGAPHSAVKPAILRLPDELLASIIGLVARDLRSDFVHGCEECSHGYNTHLQHSRSLKALSRVCRRFMRIAQPLLFRAIGFESRLATVPPSRLVQKLHHTLKGNPRFQQYCRSLHIHIPESGEESPPHKYLVASDFARWMTNMRCLSIQGGFQNNQDRTRNASTWTLIRLFVAKCKNVKHVQLSRHEWNLCLVPIFKWLDFPNLNTLSVHGISKWKHGRVELELEKRRTASFTSLVISDYEEGPEATSLFIQWPAKLSRFEFGSFYNNAHVMDYPMFESWLLIHRDTLKHVDIGYLSRNGSRRLFNATLFPNLEYLKLSRWQMHQDTVPFNNDDANVLGPRLKVFCWGFNIYDQHDEGWLAFGDPESFWIRDLVATAIARKAALQTVQIQFSPRYTNTEEGMEYPWDLMDSLRDKVLRPNGVNLVYNEPPISKENWLEYLRTWRSEVFAVADVVDNLRINKPNSIRDIEEATESSEQAGYEGGYQGEDIRKYLVSKSSN